MKHFYLAILVISLFFSFFTFAQEASNSEKELVLYNWEEYMPEAVLEEFFEETGYRVRQVYYETDDLKDELIYATQGRGMDLIVGSRYSFNKYADYGKLLADIPPEQFPNMKHIDPRWLKDSPKIRSNSVPFLWGTLGIMYRKDLVTKPVTSWAALLLPDESLKDKIIMVNDVRDSMAAALIYQGHSLNTESAKEISAAGKLLKSQRPYVKAYRYVNLGENSELITGSVHMSLGYNGDALVLKQSLDSIDYVVPKEGTQLWADFIGVFENSKNKEAAFKFINFINDPKRAAFLAEALETASCNASAEQFMSAEHLNNPLIYPPKEVIEKSEFLQPLSARATSMYNTIFINITK
ncbi:ABC transporter substrate-binding protein [Paraglaciecola aestuariivivens]